MQLGANAVAAILEDVGRYGRRRLETGGFLCSRRSSADDVSAVAIAGRQGIEKKRGLFIVSGLALDRLFTWAEERELRILAQYHSHQGRAFLSSTDLHHGLSVRGFTSCVIPFSTNPPDNPSAWGWWRFDGKDWRTTESPNIVQTLSIEIVTFDEAGVR
jgi:hypothetical protein